MTSRYAVIGEAKRLLLKSQSAAVELKKKSDEAASVAEIEAKQALQIKIAQLIVSIRAICDVEAGKAKTSAFIPYQPISYYEREDGLAVDWPPELIEAANIMGLTYILHRRKCDVHTGTGSCNPDCVYGSPDGVIVDWSKA